MRQNDQTKSNAHGLWFGVGMSLAFGLLTTSTARGKGPLFLGMEHATGKGPVSVAIGDLNGDDVPDLVLGRSEPETFDFKVVVLLGFGDGTFAPPVEYKARQGITSVALDYLDGDDVLDIAVTNAWQNNVSILLGNGDGTFKNAVNYNVAVSPIAVATGDLNGDLITDLAVANWLSNVISVLLGRGDGTFASALTFPSGGDGARSIAIGDMNGDHVPDLSDPP